MHTRMACTFLAMSAALACSLCLAASAQADASAVCDGAGMVTVTIDPGADSITSVTVTGVDVVVDADPPVTCVGLNKVVINGTTDSNVVTYSGTFVGTVTANLDAGDDRFTATGAQPVTVNGGAGADVLTGGDGVDHLNGQGDGDTVFGDAAAGDVLDGGGGAGIDTLNYSAATAGVNVNTGVSDDTATGFEHIIGSAFADELTGDGVHGTIEGGAGDDKLRGGGGDDTLQGDAGADTIYGDATAGDTLIGGSGAETDTLDYSAVGTGVDVNTGLSDDTAQGFEHIVGTASGDDLTGDAGDQTIDAGGGDDELDGGGGNDTLNGEAGADTIFGDAVAGDTLNGGPGPGNDTLDYSAVATGVDVNFGATDDDASGFEHIIGTAAADHLTGDSGDQTIDGGAGTDELRGGGGKDTLNGDPDADTIYGDAQTMDTLNGGAGPGDILTYEGELLMVTVKLGAAGGTDTASDFETVIGGTQGDVLTGTSANETIEGREGGDTIDGNGGEDTLRGEAGADTIVGDGVPGDTLDGGAGPGIDKLDYSAVAGTGVNVNTGAPDDTALNFEHIIGTGKPDRLRGDAGNQTIDGGGDGDEVDGVGGNDVLNGGAGADIIYGDGVAGDTLNGGTGSDTLDYSTASAGVNLNTGVSDDTASLFEHIIGSAFPDHLTGDSGDQTIDGGAGGDVLRGGGGKDTLNGQADPDTIYGDAQTMDDLDGGVGPGDVLTYEGEALMVTVKLDGGGGATDSALEFETVIGGTQGDVLTGSSANETIEGRGGGDTIDGNGGADILRGEAGADTIKGDGEAGDTLDGGADLGDKLDYSGVAGTGVNVNTGAPDDTAVGFELIIGTGMADRLTGDAGNQTINGGGGGDELRGGDGNDTLNGEAGNDTIFGDAVAGDTLDGGPAAGTDTLDYSAVSAGVDVNTGGTDDTATGFDRIIGTAFADLLTGDAGNQTIDGGGGNDELRGGGGNDTLNGQADADTIFGDAVAGDTLNGGPGPGDDTLDYSAVGAGVNVNTGGADDTASEFEHIIGTALVDHLTGDAGDQTIDGGAGADELRGGDGNDILNGEGDADTIFGDAVAGDTLNGGGGAGIDTLTYSAVGTAVNVNTGVSDDAATGFEHIIGTGFGDQLTGDTADQTIDGGAGDDRLDGGGGEDIINGGADNDTIVGDAVAGDTLNGGPGVGNDTLDYSAVGTGVTVNTGVADDTASGFDRIIGTAFADDLTGGGGDQTIDGGGGNDELAGGTGDDTLNGEGDDDTIFGDGTSGDTANGGPGTDTLDYSAVATGVRVNAGAPHDTASGFEHIIGTASADQLTGDAGDQTIDGGAGNDVLRGGGGNDVLNGEADADTIFGDAVAGDTLNGGGGAATDTVNYSEATAGVNVNTGASDDTASGFEHVVGSAFDDQLTGEAIDQTIDGGAGADVLRGGGGKDTLNGQGDPDTIYGDAAIDDTLSGGAGPGDVLTYEGEALMVTVHLAAPLGTDSVSGFERVIGGTQGDLLIGSGADETIEGGPGGDTINGNGGHDTLNGDAGADTIVGDGVPGDTLDGGADAVDKLDYSGVGGTGVNVNTGAPDDTAVGFEHIVGTALADRLQGDAGDQTIEALGGDDVLTGAAGADTLLGGADTDTASYAERNTGVTASLAGGGEDAISLIENLTGSGGNDDLTGNSGVNTIAGGNGSDTIHAGADAGDTLVGGTDAGHDILTYAGEIANVVIDLSSLLAPVTDKATEFEEAIGGNGNDRITGNSAPNVLRGGPGADRVFAGGDPGDTVDGGTGAGRDLLSYDGVATAVVVDLTTPGPFLAATDAASNFEDVAGGIANDTIAGDGQANTLSGGPGTDTVTYAASPAVNVTLDGVSNDGAGDGSEGDNVIAENVTGSGGADRIRGDQGANVLRSLGGNDSVIGAGGSDALDGGDDVDTVSYEDRGFAEGVTATLDGAGGAPGEADVVAAFERLVGGAGADHLAGAGGDDEILGAAGADVVSGEGGNDGLNGGEGPDVLSGGTGSDGLSGAGGNDALDGGPDPDGYDAGAGDDRVSAFDFNAENVACGDGADSVQHDAGDVLGADCESGTLLGYVPPPFALDPRPRDRDNDGSFAGFDCNDLNPDIRPGGPDLPGDGIDQNCNGSDAPFPPITIDHRLRTEKDARGRIIRRFELRRLPAGVRIMMTCKSKKAPRCFFRSRSINLKGARAKFSLRGYFGERPLSRGSTIDVKVLSPTSIGRTIHIAIRKPSQTPTVTTGCVATDGKTAVPCP